MLSKVVKCFADGGKTSEGCSPFEEMIKFVIFIPIVLYLTLILILVKVKTGFFMFLLAQSYFVLE